MIPFRPVIEPDHPGAFLKEDPAISLKTGRLSDLPWMTGITSHEGAIKVASTFCKNMDFKNGPCEISELEFNPSHSEPT